MDDSREKIERRVEGVFRELVFVEEILATRLAALRTELDSLRRELGVDDDGQVPEVDPIDLPFRRPLALESPVTVTNKYVFPHWRVGSGDPPANCLVQQLPAPESALTFPTYKLVVSLKREDDADCGFFSVEIDAEKGIGDARHCDVAIRLRSEPATMVEPVLRVFSGDNEWQDLAAEPLRIDSDFRSFATTFTLPEDLSHHGYPARLIYFLPSNLRLRVDIAYVVLTYRHR